MVADDSAPGCAVVKHAPPDLSRFATLCRQAISVLYFLLTLMGNEAIRVLTKILDRISR